MFYLADFHNLSFSDMYLESVPISIYANKNMYNASKYGKFQVETQKTRENSRKRVLY